MGRITEDFCGVKSGSYITQPLINGTNQTGFEPNNAWFVQTGICWLKSIYIYSQTNNINPLFIQIFDAGRDIANVNGVPIIQNNQNGATWPGWQPIKQTMILPTQEFFWEPPKEFTERNRGADGGYPFNLGITVAISSTDTQFTSPGQLQNFRCSARFLVKI